MRYVPRERRHCHLDREPRSARCRGRRRGREYRRPAVCFRARGALPDFHGPRCRGLERHARRRPPPDPPRHLLAERAARLVGTAMAGYDGHRGWLYSVGVHPEPRGGGSGAGLPQGEPAGLGRQPAPARPSGVTSATGRMTWFLAPPAARAAAAPLAPGPVQVSSKRNKTPSASSFGWQEPGAHPAVTALGFRLPCRNALGPFHRLGRGRGWSARRPQHPTRSLDAY